MMEYRLHEFGVERIENGTSTFIAEDQTLSAWQEFEAWKRMGHIPLPSFPQPEFPSFKNLLIVGAGGYGRELYGSALAALGNGSEWQIAGFLNDIPDSLEGHENLPPIIGTMDYIPRENDVFICAIGEAEGRKKVCEKLKQKDAKFICLIHPNTTLSDQAALGEGVIVEAHSGIGANAHIGSFSTILSHVSIAHDVHIGEYVQVSPFACILGKAEIGEGTLIGSHAVILPGVKIGKHATIGAGSVVINDVPDHATVFGIPAKRLK